MTISGFILRNAVRNRRRLVLTISSVALSLFLLTVLQVVLRGLTDPATSDEAALRLVVRHKVSLANMLFAKYKPRIERMPGVKACTRLLWFGGVYRDERNFFPQFGCDADALFQVLTEARIAPEQLDRFIRERTACVVGVKTRERFGWRIGEKITLLGAMWPCNLELTVVGEYSGGADETDLFFHHEYFDELIGDKGITGLFWVRAGSAGAVPRLIEGIDAEFSNSDAETQTETERSFQIGFVSMLGNLRMLIGSLSTVIVFTLVLVTGGTMSMAIREREKEIAILKALGFGGAQISGLILAESFALALAGGALGCGTAWLLAGTLEGPIFRMSRGLFVSFEVTAPILGQGLLVAAVLGVASCAWPVWAILRRSVLDGLRTVD